MVIAPFSSKKKKKKQPGNFKGQFEADACVFLYRALEKLDRKRPPHQWPARWKPITWRSKHLHFWSMM